MFSMDGTQDRSPSCDTTAGSKNEKNHSFHYGLFVFMATVHFTIGVYFLGSGIFAAGTDLR
jgi:hypothetical protein